MPGFSTFIIIALIGIILLLTLMLRRPSASDDTGLAELRVNWRRWQASQVNCKR